MTQTTRSQPSQRQRNPRGGRPPRRRLARHGLARRQRLAPGQPGHPDATSRPRSASSATSPTARREAWSPAAATRSRWSSPSRPADCSATRSSRACCGASAAELAARDLQLVLLMPDVRGRRASATADYLTAGHVDGALLVSLHGEDPLPARLAAAGIPMVVVGRPPKGADARATSTSTTGGARDAAVEHLIAGGRRDIATIAGPQDMAAGMDRLRRLSRCTRRGRPRPRPGPGDQRRFHPGRRSGRDDPTAGRPARHRRRLRGLGPDGRRRIVGPGRGRAARARAMSRWSASTTRPWRRPPRPD